MNNFSHRFRSLKWSRAHFLEQKINCSKVIWKWRLFCVSILLYKCLTLHKLRHMNKKIVTKTIQIDLKKTLQSLRKSIFMFQSTFIFKWDSNEEKIITSVNSVTQKCQYTCTTSRCRCVHNAFVRYTYGSENACYPNAIRYKCVLAAIWLYSSALFSKYHCSHRYSVYFFTFRLWLVYFCWPLKDSQILLYCVFYLSQLHDVITVVLFEITFIILNSNSRRLSIGLKVIFCFF